MKKILVIVLAVTLALSLALTSVVFAGGGKKEVTLAQEAGQAWLDNTVALTGEPLEWLGAHLTTPQVCYDLKGKPNAYMFTMENDGEVVGYIVVGSSDYGYPMFEAADVPPPSIPSADKGKSILERDLGLRVEKIGKPTRLLYLGFDNLYATYQVGRQEVAVNLKFDFATPASNLKASMPSPEDYKAGVEATDQSTPEVLSGSTSTAQSTGYRYKILPMTHFCSGCQYDCNTRDTDGKLVCWCGPASGVSIGKYYRDHKNYNLGSNCDMYCDFYEFMGTHWWFDFTGWGVTWPWNYGPGFVEMTQGHDYSNFSYEDNTNLYDQPNHGDYWDTADAIDNGWPSGLIAGQFYGEESGDPNDEFPPSGGHWVAIKGYLPPYPPYWYVYGIYCTDSYSGADYLCLNWYHLGYKTPIVPFLGTVTIKD